MFILEKRSTIQEIKGTGDYPNGFVKGVVDIENRKVALNADMHYELANYLKSEIGSKDQDMWGFNLWLDNDSIESILEYDSFINIKNNQHHGFLRGGMDIQSPDIENLATEVISEWILF